MSVPKLKEISLAQLAAFVSDHLNRNGIEAVLTGGACVSLYTRNAYASFDLDFVLVSFEKKRLLKKVMEDIGFRLESGCFRHRETPFFIEFLPPPPSVGEEPVKEISTIEMHGKTLKLLSPTDCVKDRLAAFYHWNDRPSLDQALLVALNQKCDVDEIGRWSSAENMKEKFETFRSRLRKSRSQKQD
ncbi:MAG: hypothetical protein JW843_12405 [Candidatus Aminicenantes bacterium]|nr:hypothetical protein [Candidatus Aminicenantes bacterium]